MSVTVSRKIAESVIFMLLSLKILRWINSKRHSVRLDWDSENFQNPVFLTDGSNLNLVAFQNPAFVMSPVDPAWLQPDSTTQDAHFQFGDALPGLRTEGTTFSCLGFDPRCRETTIYKRLTSNLAMRFPVSELKEQVFHVWGFDARSRETTIYNSTGYSYKHITTCNVINLPVESLQTYTIIIILFQPNT